MASRKSDDRKHVRDEDKFPTGQMITLAICKFSEPIAFYSVIAYTYLMVQDLFDGDDTNASFYAGLLVSTYAFGEVFTTFIWGAISDRIGRKPIVLSGLVGVAISCMIFGLAKKYWVALVARLIGGMLNGNVAVMQTMLAEMVKRPEHEPTAYAIHPFVWFAGGILGSAMGGYLAQPAQYYPSIFPPGSLFDEYPYLLPNLVCVAAIVIAVIQGMIFLEETNPILVEKSKARRHEQSQSGETSPLLSSDSKCTSIITTGEADGRSESVISRKPSVLFEDSLPGPTDPHFDLRRSSFGTMHSIQVRTQPQPPSTTSLPPSPSWKELPKPTFKETFNFTIVMLVFSLVIASYHSMGYGNMLPIYLLDTPSPGKALGGSIDLRGGLGYDVHAVGSFMAVNGFMAVLVQALIFPIVVSRLGVWRSFVTMVMLYPIAYAIIPFVTLLPPGAVRSAGIYALMIFQNHLIIIIPPCALILIKNATPSPLVLGTVNGATMSVLCLARTIAPPVEGIIYGAGGSAAAWFSMAGIAAVAVFHLYFVPREKARVDAVDVDNGRFGGGPGEAVAND